MELSYTYKIAFFLFDAASIEGIEGYFISHEIMRIVGGTYMKSVTSHSRVQKIVQTGLFIAIAAVLQYFSRYTSIYIAGIQSIKISLAGPFTKMPAVLFGPAFGAASGGLTDIIGYLMNPTGPYIPWLTLTSALDGVITALLWYKFAYLKVERVSSYFGKTFAIIGVIGLFNHAIVLFMPQTSFAGYIGSLEKNGPLLTLVLEIAALIGLAFYFIGRVIKIKKSLVYENFVKLMIAVGIGGIVETTINTWILQLYFAPLAKMSFIVFWIPRLVEELVMTLVQSYLISLLLVIYVRVRGRAIA